MPFNRTLVWIVTLTHTLLASGLPLPFGAGRGQDSGASVRHPVSKDRSRPFPCMDSPCGCGTAEQCFESCCCHSVAERAAWARRRGIDADVVAALERRAGAERRAAPVTGGGNCCTVAAAPPSRAAASESSCCDQGPGDAATDDREPSEADPGDAVGPEWVTLRAYLACRGMVAEWATVGGALPPARVEAGSPPAPSGVVEVTDATVVSPSRTPESPPPEAE